MKKSELNVILKSLGYGSMRYSSSSYIQGAIVKRYDKILKGIVVGSKGPFSSSDIETSINSLIKKFEEEGFVYNRNDSLSFSFYILQSSDFKLTLALDDHRAYASRDMDECYRTVFVRVNVENIKK